MRAIVRAHKKYAHGGTSIKSAQVVLYSDDPRGLASTLLYNQHIFIYTFIIAIVI